MLDLSQKGLPLGAGTWLCLDEHLHCELVISVCAVRHAVL